MVLLWNGVRAKGLVRGNPEGPSASASVCHRLSARRSGGTPILTLLTSTASACAGVPLRVRAPRLSAWRLLARSPSSPLLRLSGGGKRGGTADTRPGTQQTLTALQTLPNQHAVSPPFENKNGARMDRWEAGSRSQLRRAGGGFPEGTAVRGRARGHLRGKGPRRGRCDQQAGGQAVSSVCPPASQGTGREGRWAEETPRMRVQGQGAPTHRGQGCGHRARRPPLGCPGGRPRDPDLLAAAETIQRPAPFREQAPLCSAGTCCWLHDCVSPAFSARLGEVGAFPPGQVSTRLFCLPLPWWEKRAGRACDL